MNTFHTIFFRCGHAFVHMRIARAHRLSYGLLFMCTTECISLVNLLFASQTHTTHIAHTILHKRTCSVDEIDTEHSFVLQLFHTAHMCHGWLWSSHWNRCRKKPVSTTISRCNGNGCMCMRGTYLSLGQIINFVGFFMFLHQLETCVFPWHKHGPKIVTMGNQTFKNVIIP